MNRSTQGPGVIEGIAIAAGMSLGGGALYLLLRLVMVPAEALTLAIATIGLAYLLYLLWRSREPAGRITAVSIWGVVTVPVLLLMPAWTLASQLVLLWLTRVLFLQRGFIAALADLGLVLVGLGGAAWAMTATGSLAAATWTFLLMQAPFAALGTALSNRGRSGNAAVSRADDDARFERAERSAESSLHRLAQTSRR